MRLSSSQPEQNGFPNIPYHAIPRHMHPTAVTPFLIVMPRDRYLPVSTAYYPDLADYAAFRRDKLHLLGIICNRYEIPVEVRQIIIDMAY